MKVKVFDKNDKGKIEFTRKELEALLNEVFEDGYREGKESKSFTWTSPSWSSITTAKPYETYYTTSTCNSNTALHTTQAKLDTSECVYYGVEDYNEDQLSLQL